MCFEYVRNELNDCQEIYDYEFMVDHTKAVKQCFARGLDVVLRACAVYDFHHSLLWSAEHENLFSSLYHAQ